MTVDTNSLIHLPIIATCRFCAATYRFKDNYRTTIDARLKVWWDLDTVSSTYSSLSIVSQTTRTSANSIDSSGLLPSALAKTPMVCIRRESIAERLSILLYESCPQKAVLIKLSSKVDEFLAGRSQFDSDHGVDFYAPTCCLSTTFVLPLFAFVLCFLRQKNHK